MTKQIIAFLFLIGLSTVSFAQGNDVPDTLWLYSKSTDKTYGKSAENAIKIGFGKLPVHLNRYLNNLADENGRHVKFVRVGSEEVAGRNTPISIYAIESPGKSDTLFFDNFEWETPKLVMGYLWKERREGYYGEYANDADTLGTGPGDYFYPDGTYFKGNWINGQRQGFGRLYYPIDSDKRYMEGSYINDKPSGRFKIVMKNGTVSTKDY